MSNYAQRLAGGESIKFILYDQEDDDTTVYTVKKFSNGTQLSNPACLITWSGEGPGRITYATDCVVSYLEHKTWIEVP